MRLVRLVAVFAVALVCTPAAASAAKPPTGVFVGKAGRVAFGVALDSRGVLAYACDGRRLGAWFKGPVKRSSRLSLRASGRRLSLTARGSTLRARFAGRTATLRRARGKVGLYRSESVTGRGKRLGGWVVLPGGRQVGVVAGGTSVAPAPQLSTTSLTAGSLVAGSVVAPSEVGPLVVDLDGDGLGLTGITTTSLLGGGARSVRWTTPGDDDVFVVLDAAKLKAAGYTLSQSGRVLARGGLRITRGGVTTTAVDGLHLLRLLNGNGDGILSPADPAWEALLTFGDLNGNGAMNENFGDKIDSLRELGHLDALALQARIDQRNQLYTALANAIKAANSVALAVIRNLK